MLKNPTPRQISLSIAMLLAFILLLFFLVFRSIQLINIPLIPLLIISLACFIIAYFTALYFIRRFVYRRIKVIYKNIHRSKRGKADKISLDNMNDNAINEVEKEVEEWVNDQDTQIQNLQSLETYRREFLGNISHELKTPIFNIQGYIHTLLDGGLYDENINEDYLRRAASNTERLQVIVEDLDAISKLESGELTLEKRSFDIKNLVSEIFDDLQIMASERGITLGFKDGANNNYIVNADKESIRQVLVNLITNSIKYGTEGGRTKVSFYDMDNNILIEVADNGIGIDKEHLPHLFDRFYRVDKSRSRTQGGSGLGLAIVKHIIEAHKQTINVRSAKELGSTFGFTLAKANS